MTVRPPTLVAQAKARAGLWERWRKYAACRGLAALMDPPYWADDTEREALQVCWACPVMWSCRASVLALPETADWGGVCGGLTERERTERRRRGRRS